MVKILNCYLYAKKVMALCLRVQFAGLLDPLYKLQKRIIRIITKSPYKAHTTPLFKKLNKLKINDICKLEIAKKCFA